MNTMNVIKKFVLTTSLLAVAGVVSAHDQSGVLGKNSRVVDYYQVQCFNDGTGDAKYLEAAIIDTGGIKAKPVISVQVIKGLLAYNSTDNGRDGNAKFSPTLRVNGGNGSYQVLVDKNKAGRDDYNLLYHCKTKTNQHTGTSIAQLQNK